VIDLHDASQSRIGTAILDAQLKIQDAAFRIVIFSPSEVVKAFAAFVQENHNQECAPTRTGLAVYQTMRRQTLSSDNISDEDIAMALFGCKLK
jgi:oligoribonuclease (3'-5' exoribonuclease)